MVCGAAGLKPGGLVVGMREELQMRPELVVVLLAVALPVPNPSIRHIRST
jgi:hypothetical protein